jgi:hypothetical protein
MRTTLDIEDDILVAAKELAKHEGRTAGQVLSDLARKGLTAGSPKKFTVRDGVPVFPSRGEVITMEKIQQIMDQEGI